ncbi:cytochrome P450 [Dendrothele bispora CBS 962.96]|uniref:Cytochrome P450 n=1 Tax=Dendrothele bispora (strain CBS 962.96) TaxID=1314807 RepID=A0A4S8LKZ4_DENBC|nr:cytochrome P450 [Dendrothele bispora CBS 962.96]
MYYGLLACVAAIIYLVFAYTRRGNKHYPQGPPGIPIVGNALQIPNDRQWLKFHEWKKEYGDVMRITVLGHPSIILSSLKAANDLLESRGTIYSNRPDAIMAGELVGWNRGLGYAQMHSPRFREFRRLFHQFMGPRACATEDILHVQERENLRLLGKLLDDPEHFVNHARDCTSSTILLLSYGYPSYSGDPLRLVKIAEDAMAGFARASEPGRWWVDSFPALRYVPDWVPGASFKHVAAAMRKDLDTLYDVPFNFVRDEMKMGRAFDSFVGMYIEEKNGEVTSEEEEMIKAAAASLYSGGAETTPSSITSFILAMTLYPSVQRRAQVEIDKCIARSSSDTLRLPDFSDRQDLPYISALVLEIWRWNPSVPLGLPHYCLQDDEYEGHFIEKGTTVWANIWSILHDEEVFPDPLEFRPERYLDEAGNLKTGKGEPAEAILASFGFGRRICPGMYLAENSMFITVATILSAFQISKVFDPQSGKEIVPEVEYDGFISHPRPFQCKITPRSTEMENLIRKTLENLPT